MLHGLNLVLGFAVAVLLARLLGPGGYGVYSFGLAIVTLIAIPTQTGVATLTVREVARYRYEHQWGLLHGLFRLGARAVVVVSLLVILAAAGVILLAADQLEPSTRATYLVALALIPLMSMCEFLGATLRGFGRITQGQLPQMVLRPGVLLGFLLLMPLVGGELTSTEAMFGHVLAVMVALACLSVFMGRTVPATMRSAAPSYDRSAWLKSMLPLSLLAGTQVLANQTDIVMLGVMLSSEEVGAYRVASQGAVLVGIFATAINLVISPEIARLHSMGEWGRMQRYVIKAARVMFVGGLLVTTVFIVFGENLLVAVFGESYRDAYTVLLILCGGQLVNMALGPLLTVLNMIGRERQAANWSAVGAALNVTLNLIMIPLFGVEGAALATGLSLALWRAGLSIQLRRELQIKTSVLSRLAE